MSKDTELVRWENIKAEIAECQDIEALGKLNYSLEAIRKWARQSKQSLETQNEIAEYRLRLNRKQGEWIEANIPEEGGKSSLDYAYQLNSVSKHTLAEVGIDRNDSPKFRILAQIPEGKFNDFVLESKANHREITTRDACALLQKPHVSFNSGESEWYTPEPIIEAARQVMGSINVDPASSDKANEIVKAETYFTEETDGRYKNWIGNVWLNPPYTQPLVSEFCNLLVMRFGTGDVRQACVLVNNATETLFYQNMLRVCSAVCFIKGRVKFISNNGSQGAPLQGQTILYLGNHTKLFGRVFSKFGVILYAE